MKYFFCISLFLAQVFCLNAQDIYTTRTAHIQVKSTNSIQNVEADNYQLRGNIDPATGKVSFMGLLKSFEFKLGAIDQAFNHDKVNLTKYPKINYDGHIVNLDAVNFKKAGTYRVNIEGFLYIWDEKRKTKAKGKIIVNPDGSIRTESNFNMMIEEKNVAKFNKLVKENMPSVFSLDMNSFGVSRSIDVKLQGNFTTKFVFKD